MSPTTKSRKRIRRSQLLADRVMPVGEPWRYQDLDDRSWAQRFDDWMLSYLSTWVAATLCVLAGGLFTVLAIRAVHDINDLHAYQNAPSCADVAVTPCRADVPVTIIGVGDTGGKHPTDYIAVYGLSQPITHIELPPRSAAWAAARDMDNATVELWHSTPVSITVGNATSETNYAPHKSVVGMASLALVALVGTAMFGLYWLRRLSYKWPGGKPWPEWLAVLEPTALFATAGFFIAGLLGISVESLIVTVAVGGGITVLVGASFAVNSWRVMARKT